MMSDEVEFLVKYKTFTLFIYEIQESEERVSYLGECHSLNYRWRQEGKIGFFKIVENFKYEVNREEKKGFFNMKSYQEFKDKLEDIKYSTDPKRVVEKLYDLIYEMLEVMNEKEVKKKEWVQSWENIPDNSRLFLDEEDEETWFSHYLRN